MTTPNTNQAPTAPAKHTEGKLKICGNQIFEHRSTSSDILVATINYKSGQAANAARLAKCWNEHDTLTAQVEWYREREKELKTVLQQCVDVLDEYRNEFSAHDSRRREVSIKARELLR